MTTTPTPIPASPIPQTPRVRCFRRADGQTIEGCDRIRFRSHGTCEMVYRDDTFEVLPMSISEADLAVRRGIWVEVPDSSADRQASDAAELQRLRKVEDEAAEQVICETRGVKDFSPTEDSFKRWEEARAARIAFEAKIGGGV